MTNLIEMSNISKSFGGSVAVDRVSLELLPDELRSGSAALAAGAAANAPRLDRDLSGRVSMKELVRETTAQLEKELIVQALDQTGANVTRAAQLLMISRKSLQNKMKEFGLREES